MLSFYAHQGRRGKFVRTAEGFARSEHWKTISLQDFFRINKKNVAKQIYV